MAPVLVKKWRVLNFPIDAGLHFRGKQLLGPGKTWRGWVFGSIAAGLAALVFALITQGKVLSFSYTTVFLLGVFLGCLALAGDLVKSFFKRQLGIKRGGSWFPFDQVDWVIGLLIGVRCIPQFLPWSNVYLSLIFIGLIAHLLVKYWGNKLNIDDKPF